MPYKQDASVSVHIMPSTALESTNYLFNFFTIASAGLIAGLVIAFYNYHLSKKERRYKIADSFCVNLETLILEYFAEKNGKRQKIIADNFSAYLESFMFFVQSGQVNYKPKIKEFIFSIDKFFSYLVAFFIIKEPTIDRNEEIRKQWFLLLDLDSGKITSKKALSAVAKLRYYLTK